MADTEIERLPIDGIESGPLIYRCAVYELFVKRSVKPTTNRIIKVKKELGHCLHSTGAVWTGPSGGRWAELDARYGEAGWALVEGPGFGLSGPALLDARDPSLLVVEVFLLGGMEKGGDMQGVIWNSILKKEVTIGEVKNQMARDLGLRKSSCVLSKDKPCVNGVPGSNAQRLPVDFMPELKDGKALGDCGFEEDAAILLLVYVGDMPDGIELRRKPLPKLRDASEARELGVL
mmetsp:Transcript_97088/g.257981  ORF Transcript_97088/g.257981 Transcript_97088/m.257981 type:complete len:233 (-) Transcript_97088:33-731(-)